MMVKATAIDASSRCEDSYKEQNIDFLRLDLGSEPLPLHDCQVITLFETIEHIFDTDLLLKSIRESLSKDGVLLVTTLNVVAGKTGFWCLSAFSPLTLKCQQENSATVTGLNH